MDANVFNLKICLYTVALGISSLLGGFDKGIEILLVMIVIDYITGILKAIYLQELCSFKGSKGLIKKVGILIVVAVAVQLERVVSQPELIHNMVAYAFIINEAISILENIAAMDVLIPKQLLKFLEKVKKQYK